MINKMASTRSKNTPGNYCLEQRQYHHVEQWRLYEHGANGVAVHTGLAGNGLLNGPMPSRVLSTNATDIESRLFGINATNLVTPAAPLTPHLNRLDMVDIYQRPPVIMPPTLEPSVNQRPFPAP